MSKIVVIEDKIFDERMYSLIMDGVHTVLDKRLPKLPTTKADPAKYATSRQLAKRYGVHYNTIYNWHKQGYFPKHVVDGVTLYAVKDIDAFIESKAANAATA